MSSKYLAYMTIPELLDFIREATDELQLRCMETAGEQRRMVCGATGKTCCWCKPTCMDRRPETE